MQRVLLIQQFRLSVRHVVKTAKPVLSQKSFTDGYSHHPGFIATNLLQKWVVLITKAPRIVRNKTEIKHRNSPKPFRVVLASANDAEASLNCFGLV